ncbi:hypothetical protein HZS_2579 [Henneguya salminicola]|nr:hypothetical protein HZS_2579 [Henneguya salminicola]
MNLIKESKCTTSNFKLDFYFIKHNKIFIFLILFIYIPLKINNHSYCGRFVKTWLCDADELRSSLEETRILHENIE